MFGEQFLPGLLALLARAGTMMVILVARDTYLCQNKDKEGENE